MTWSPCSACIATARARPSSRSIGRSFWRRFLPDERQRTSEPRALP